MFYKFYKNLILINPCVFLSYSIKTQDTDENYILWFKAIKVFVFDHIFSNLMWNRRIFLFKRFYNHDLALTIELFPVGSDGKASAYNVGDLSLIPGLGRSPGEGNDNPLQYSGKSHGRRSLVGYSPWSRKESDRTERLHFTIELFTQFM